MSTADEIDTLKNLIQKLEKERDQKHLKKKVLGFTLSIINSGNGFPQWRAYGCYEGKRANIYIGSDPEKAEEKIRVWVEKNPHFKKFVEQNQ